jgi:hypothetical protein
MAVGNMRKMSTHVDAHVGDQVQYVLNLSEDVNMNDLIGQEIHLEWRGVIHCSKCSKVTRKSFGQGFCYPCFATAPEAAECIIRPELCRAQGETP